MIDFSLKLVRIAILFISMSFLIAGCETAPPEGNAIPEFATPDIQSTSSPIQAPTPTVFSPEDPQKDQIQTEILDQATQTISSVGSVQLAYLHDFNLWIVDIQNPEAAQQLTQSGGILSFAWAPDGNRLATFDGRELCHVYLDNAPPECIDLGLDENQIGINRQIEWSPDMRTIVLWNPINPWDEYAIGWIIIPLDQPNQMLKILDPVDWGAEVAPDNEPGGVTGEAKFLRDGTLIGTITHRWLCGESGCHYQLYYFDVNTMSLKPYPNNPEEGFSEGMGLSLSNDSRKLMNFGTFHTGCEAYITFMDLFDIEGKNRNIINYPQMAVNAVALSPDGQMGVLAHNAGCSTYNQDPWAQTCGLSVGFDIYPMQLIDSLGQKIQDLPPGIQPTWSPNSEYIAFRSCLAFDGSGNWQTTTQAPPGIYALEWSTSSLIRIADGEMPQWKP